MKKYIILTLAIILSITKAYSARKTIVLKLDPNKHCLDQKKRGSFLKARLKPKTRYYVRITGYAWLSGDTGQGADPVYGVMTYYRVHKNGKDYDRYKVLRNRDRFVFVSSASNPIFVSFIMEIYSKRNNRGSFKITIRELGSAR